MDRISSVSIYLKFASIKQVILTIRSPFICLTMRNVTFRAYSPNDPLIQWKRFKTFTKPQFHNYDLELCKSNLSYICYGPEAFHFFFCLHLPDWIAPHDFPGQLTLDFGAFQWHRNIFDGLYRPTIVVRRWNTTMNTKYLQQKKIYSMFFCLLAVKI